MYNLIECSDNYSKTSETLQQYCRGEPALADDGAIADFTEANAINYLFKIKEKITGKTSKHGEQNVEIMAPLKCLRNLWRTLEMALINCGINLDLNWSKNCIIAVTDAANQVITFSITDTKLYVLGSTLSTQDNAKLLEQLKSGFKRTIKQNNNQSKKSIEKQNQYLNYLIGPSFQGVNKLFVLSFENEAQTISYKKIFSSDCRSKEL